MFGLLPRRRLLLLLLLLMMIHGPHFLPFKSFICELVIPSSYLPVPTYGDGGVGWCGSFSLSRMSDSNQQTLKPYLRLRLKQGKPPTEPKEEPAMGAMDPHTFESTKNIFFFLYFSTWKTRSEQNRDFKQQTFMVEKIWNAKMKILSAEACLCCQNVFWQND